MKKDIKKDEIPLVLIMMLVLFIIIVPILLNVFNHSAESKGFWGSYIGGIIGALGVIFTTYFLIESNKQAIIHSAAIQDKQVREREFTSFILKQLEELVEINSLCIKLVYKDMNLMREVSLCLEELQKFELNLPKIEMHRDKHKYDELVRIYEKVKKEEQDVRYEIIKNLSRLRYKKNFIPTLIEDINELENILNSNAKDIKDYYKNYNYGDILPQKYIDKCKEDYLNIAHNIETKLSILGDQVLNEYLKR